MKIRYQKKEGTPKQIEPDEIRKAIQNLMWEKVGIVRREAELQEANSWVQEFSDIQPNTRSSLELQNMLHISRLMISGALARAESRGAHYRSDYPDRDDEKWLRHITFRRPDGDVS